MKAILEIVDGPYAGKKIRLEPGRVYRVGRAEQADFVVQDARMSRLHFALEWDGEKCLISDLNSSNGTLLDGRRLVEAVEAQNGNTIYAGETSFAVKIYSDVIETTLPAFTETPVQVFPQSDFTAKPQAQVPTLLSSPPEPPVPLISQSPADDQSRVVEAAAQEQSVAPSTAGHSAEAAQATTLKERLLQILRQQSAPLFALLDAARAPEILETLRGSQEKYQSLYEGAKGAELAAYAPYIVQLPAGSGLLEKLVNEGWGNSWGVYLTSTTPFDKVRRYLRQFLMVKLADGREVYFRFYDPRVLRAFLPTCTPDEMSRLFGPISCYLMEGENSETLLQFTNSGQGSVQKAWSLSAHQDANISSHSARKFPVHGATSEM
ncbi:MAG: DUF4123 domain-containing protein [Pyrinomonadaceae bacterium]